MPSDMICRGFRDTLFTFLHLRIPRLRPPPCPSRAWGTDTTERSSLSAIRSSRLQVKNTPKISSRRREPRRRPSMGPARHRAAPRARCLFPATDFGQLWAQSGCTTRTRKFSIGSSPCKCASAAAHTNSTCAIALRAQCLRTFTHERARSSGRFFETRE